MFKNEEQLASVNHHASRGLDGEDETEVSKMIKKLRPSAADPRGS